MKKFIKKIAIVCEIFLIPFTYVSALWLGLLRKRKGWFRLNWKLLKSMEVIPIINHYYEPLISKKQLRYSLGQERKLSAIDFNINEQLEILRNFQWQDELIKIQKEPNKNNKDYYYHNGSYEAGDAEYLYSMIRLKKPKNIIEIGCGNSTLMSLKAIRKNKEEDNNYICKLICIEPYEQQWLEDIKEIEIIRKKVEDIEIEFFGQLENNDILLIHPM